MVCIDTRFHMPSSHDALFIAMKLRAKDMSRTAAILPFNIMQRTYVNILYVGYFRYHIHYVSTLCNW
jgi:hypothetical protein